MRYRTPLQLDPLRQAIARPVVALFNDSSRGEAPIPRRTDGLFGPGAVAWRVHGDVTGMLTGGVASLLLQMLDPVTLAGVWDHSDFRTDMQGRLRRTARFIALTTYASRDEADATIARVRRIHDRVRGNLPDGTPYAANDPVALAWVHATETSSFLKGFVRYAEPAMSGADQDRYFAEMAQIGEALGAAPVPTDRRTTAALIAAARSRLHTDDRTRIVARLVLHQKPAGLLIAPLQALAIQAGVELLPDWARRMHGLHIPALARPATRIATSAMAQTLRWAFAG